MAQDWWSAWMSQSSQWNATTSSSCLIIRLTGQINQSINLWELNSWLDCNWASSWSIAKTLKMPERHLMSREEQSEAGRSLRVVWLANIIKLIQFQRAPLANSTDCRNLAVIENCRERNIISDRNRLRCSWSSASFRASHWGNSNKGEEASITILQFAIIS